MVLGTCLVGLGDSACTEQGQLINHHCAGTSASPLLSLLAGHNTIPALVGHNALRSCHSEPTPHATFGLLESLHQPDSSSCACSAEVSMFVWLPP